jgi:dienelactone hydrolase
MPAHASLPRRWRPLLALVTITAGLLGAPARADARAQPAWPAWAGTPGGVFRSGAYDHGQWIYTNGIHQALGANSDALHRTDYFRGFYPTGGDPTFASRDLYNALTYDFFGSHRATHNGDYQLPTDPARWPEGTADLAELRLTADANYLYVRFLWNSFPRPNAQIATLTFSTAGATTLARPWPRKARLSSPWQAALTVWGSGGALVRAPAGTETAVDVRTTSHTTEARIPLSQLPGGPWTLSGGAGLQDPAASGSYWTVPPGNANADHPGSGGPLAPTNVWDLLFADDRPWTFDELHQADQLAGGTTSATASVDPAALARGATNAGSARTGDLSRMFASRLFTADGIRKEPGVGVDTQPPAGFQPPIPTPDFDVTFLYTGRLQYYGMHVPQSYPGSKGARPLIVYLHGFTGLPDEAFYNPVGLIQAADQRGYLVATPLGRGDYFYRGEGDLDVLEVIRDVERHYRVDPNRIYLMGHSMGGYGTNNVATHHPDLFAAVSPAEGTDSIPLHANLRNLPWFEISALQDLDAGASDAKKMYAGLSGDGYDAQLLVYSTKIHEYSSIYDTLPDLFKFFGAHRRNANPGVVTWTRPAKEDRPELGLVYDGAYWVHGVKALDPAKLGTITVESNRIPHAKLDPAHAHRSDTAVDTGGPTGRSKGELFASKPAVTANVAASNSLRINATGIGAVSIDGSRARVGFSKAALTIGTATDAPLRIALTHLQSARAVLLLDGKLVRNVRTKSGAVTVTAPAGRHKLVLRPVKATRVRQPRGAHCAESERCSHRGPTDA